MNSLFEDAASIRGNSRDTVSKAIPASEKAVAIVNVRSGAGARHGRPGIFFATLAILAALASGQSAQASSLQIGGNYNNINVNFEGTLGETIGGGSVTPSYLDGSLLPYLYCVQIEVDIHVPGTYSATVTNDGKIFGNEINNASEVAYLLNTYAPTATSADAQSGLQAAIWKTIYGSDFDLTANNSAGTISYYDADLTNVGSLPVGTVDWISPSNSDGSPAQGLITSVPEPSAIVLAAIGGLGCLGYGIRRRKTATV